MKLFRLLSTTAATVLAIAALAVSASAEMSATYDPATGKATISGIEYNADAAQKTLLILNEDATTVNAGHIVQIDQAATIATVTVGNLSADIDAANNDALAAYATALATYETALEAYNADKTEEAYATISAAYTTVSAAYADLTAAFAANATDTYYVRVGGAGAVDETTQKVLIDACELTVETTVENTYAEPIAPEEPEEPEEPEDPQPGDDDYPYLKGDINKDGWIGIDDVEIMLMYEAGEYDYDMASDEDKFLGDCNVDDWIGIDDVQEALIVEAGDESDYIVQYE